MLEPELRKLEVILASAVEFEHWKMDIERADSLSAVQNVRFSLYETENSNLSREQVSQLHTMIDWKEKIIAGQQSSRSCRSSEKNRLENNIQEEKSVLLQMDRKPVRQKRR